MAGGRAWDGVAWDLGDACLACEIMKSAIDVWLPMKGTECISALVLDGLNVKTSSKILSKARLKRVSSVWVCASPRFEPGLAYVVKIRTSTVVKPVDISYAPEELNLFASSKQQS